MSYVPRPSYEQAPSSSSVLSETDEDADTLETLMGKLDIERRIQYGAEKMLDVIEQRGGSSGEEQDQIKDRITAQLEAANIQIKNLESRLEKIRGSTPNKSRRRPPARINGYASSSSLNPPLSKSMSSSLLAGSSRPRMSRKGSSLTPDRGGNGGSSYSSAHGTPSRRGAAAGGATSSPSAQGSPSMRRTESTGQESYMTSKSDRTPWSRSPSNMDMDILRSEVYQDDENMGVLVETVSVTLRRLREISRRLGRGKGKEVERGDEPWDCLTRVADMLKKSSALRVNINVRELVQSVIPYLADSSTPRRRAAGYRALRYALTRTAWGIMVESGLEWLFTKSFSRDSKAVIEREHALRLLRTVMTLPAERPRLTCRISSRDSPSRRSSPLSPRKRSMIDTDLNPTDILLAKRVSLTGGMIRAIVSVAENPDDALRTVCMETLIEIAILDLDRLVQADAFRTILLALKDGPTELGPAITGMLIILSNSPETRDKMMPGSDVELVLAGLTEEYGNQSKNPAKFVEKLQGNVKNVGMMMSSWPGLLYLCMDDCRAIKSLISSLYVPVPELREALTDLIFSVLRIKLPTFTEAFLEGKRLTVYNRTQQATSQTLQETLEEEDGPPALNMVDHFIAFMLAVLLESGIMAALTTLIEENTPLSRKATLLLGEVLRLANRILPLQYAAQLQSLPRFFNGATAFADAGQRNFALTALSSIDSLNRNQIRVKQFRGGGSATISRERASSTGAGGGIDTRDPVLRGQRSVFASKLKAGMGIEDRLFQQMIVDSGVLLGRDHTKWNYDIILELIEGPLLNPKRLDEAIRATKFIRRLFSFYHPYNNRFSSIKKTRPSHKWVKLGCMLISTMLTCPEGLKFLLEDQLLKQLSTAVLEIEANPNRMRAIFSSDRVENSLSYGYFEMIGTLSKHEEGIKMLEKYRIFNSLYHLLELKKRDDLVQLILENLDYTSDTHARILISKAMTSTEIETRLFATHHLGRLIHENQNLQDWALQLLITQLYDTSIEVCDIAVMYLEEIGTDPVALEKVVEFQPCLEHLDDIGYPLFMRFVSTSVGFEYLHRARYIDQELENWVSERNLLYVIEVETFVTRTIRPFTSDTVEEQWQTSGMTPPHFFGELTKTPEGCRYLREKGLVAEFAEVVRLHGMECGDQVVMTNVKSVLWALGHLGSNPGGLIFLEDEEIIEVIVEIAEQSPVLTMKGTCFYVLGLISTSVMGAEILEEYGWIATRTPLGRPTGICLPNDIGRFAYIEPWIRTGATVPPSQLPKLSGIEEEIMGNIAKLSNFVLAAKAMNNLKRLRTRHPRYFSSITLFHRSLHIISTNHFQAPVRRFIMDLFDIKIESDTLIQLRHIEASTTTTISSSSSTGNQSLAMNSKNISSTSPIGSNSIGQLGGGRGSRNLNMIGSGTTRPGITPLSSTRRSNTEYLADVDFGDNMGVVDGIERRRRSASSPGPEPPGRVARLRGLTISEIGT